ncbi:MAG: NUDIX domain-containing protein [Candidatus Omnitrophica bacterium]|nr:NUDIX domain-containing protein [Candidatus Omnitrophota bacterium]
MLKPFYLAVRGVLKDEQGRFLLLQRSRDSRHQPGFWEFPGGKVDPGENFADALIREFKEETGLDIHLSSVLTAGEWEREEYKIVYLFMCVDPVGGEICLSREHDDWAWMTDARLQSANISPQLQPLRDLLLSKKDKQ